MKVYVLRPNENWIVDRFVDEWSHDNSDITAQQPHEADVVWLLADWAWNQCSRQYLQSRKVLTTIHHIVPEKFTFDAAYDFKDRDDYTTAYHVYNERTRDFVSSLTNKPIHLIKYWANQHIWRPSGTRDELRIKHGLPQYGYLIGSFQRDTEGQGIPQGVFLPKLEKGPDLLVDFIEKKWDEWVNTDLSVAGEPRKPHVVLAGWRRQYVIDRLKKIGISYTYFDRPKHDTVNELYQTLDIYPVTARHEGGPQSLIECGLLNVPVVSRPVGIAEQVLPPSAINDDVKYAIPSVPNVEDWKLPKGYEPYRELLLSL
jgi:hypothetical protein